MGKSYILVLALLFFAVFSARADNSDVVINEIMYHPPNDLEAEEFVELYLRGHLTKRRDFILRQKEITSIKADKKMKLPPSLGR